jgi:hypothetical protein
MRRSYREGDRIRHETLGNISALPQRRSRPCRPPSPGGGWWWPPTPLRSPRSLPHGHVAAVWAMARKLGLPALLGPAGPERDLVMALVIARVLQPDSKLATTRWWQDTTLAVDLGVDQATTDQVYAAMDWLGDRQAKIEAALARRHLASGGLV